jgi:hypothetical protein
VRVDCIVILAFLENLTLKDGRAKPARSLTAPENGYISNPINNLFSIVYLLMLLG